MVSPELELRRSLRDRGEEEWAVVPARWRRPQAMSDPPRGVLAVTERQWWFAGKTATLQLDWDKVGSVHLYRERFRTLVLVRNLDPGVINRPLPGSYRFTVSRRADVDLLQALKRHYGPQELMFDWE